MCEHEFSKLGIFNGDGTISVPCLYCDSEARVHLATMAVTFIEDGFAPVFASGVKLDLVKDNDIVSKIVCREIHNDYDLDNLNLKRDEMVLDIGAHKGIVSCYLGKRYPGINIIAFEPSKENFAVLCENGERNKLNMIAINAAVTSDGRPVHITINEGNTGGGNIYGDGEQVKSYSLRAIFDMFGIERLALLKIDCEGAEFEILRGNEDLLDRVDRVRGEFHYNQDADELLAMVKSHVPDTNVVFMGVKA
jgi:FkbM family methyltransferase